MADPSWLHTWPTHWPDIESIYRAMAPRQWPRGIYSEDGEAYKDQTAVGHCLSWIRKLTTWIMEHIWPWLDGRTTSHQQFLARWLDVFSIKDRGADGPNVRAILTAMRSRGTLTYDVLKQLCVDAYGLSDPDEIALATPTHIDISAEILGATVPDWQFSQLAGDAYIYDVNGGNGESEPDRKLMADIVSLIQPAGSTWYFGRQLRIKYDIANTGPGRGTLA